MVVALSDGIYKPYEAFLGGSFAVYDCERPTTSIEDMEKGMLLYYSGEIDVPGMFFMHSSFAAEVYALYACMLYLHYGRFFSVDTTVTFLLDCSELVQQCDTYPISTRRHEMQVLSNLQNVIKRSTRFSFTENASFVKVSGDAVKRSILKH